MNKLNASYENTDNLGKYYSVNSKKGQGRISLRVIPEQNCIKIRIEGYGEFSEFISKKVDEEMRVFLGRREHLFKEGNINEVKKLLIPAKREIKEGISIKNENYQTRTRLWNEIRENKEKYQNGECELFFRI